MQLSNLLTKQAQYLCKNLATLFNVVYFAKPSINRDVIFWFHSHQSIQQALSTKMFHRDTKEKQNCR